MWCLSDCGRKGIEYEQTVEGGGVTSDVRERVGLWVVAVGADQQRA